MKLSVSSYSYYQAIISKTLTYNDLMQKAKDMGFSGIELAGIHVPDGMKKNDHAASLARKAEELGLEIVCYSIGANFLCDNPKNEVERVKGEVDTAHFLGTKYLRHDMCFAPYAMGKGYRSFERNLPLLIECAKEVAEYAEQYGISTMVENHGTFCQDSGRIEALVDGVNKSNYGALIDIGNFLCVDEDPAKAVGVLKGYAFHVHAKDFFFKDGTNPPEGDGWYFTRGGNYLRGAAIGDGIVPVEKCLRILKSAGYDSYITVEYEGHEDCISGIERGKKQLEKIIQRL